MSESIGTVSNSESYLICLAALASFGTVSLLNIDMNTHWPPLSILCVLLPFQQIHNESEDELKR